jgi:endo-1,3-1,4-beta-glycanase ExoK
LDFSNLPSLLNKREKLIVENRRLLRLVLAILPAGLVFILLLSGSSGQAQTGDPSYLPFTDDFDSFDSTLWNKADGWTNGDPFDCGWQADNVLFDGGVMTLQLDDTGCPCSERDYASGEYRSNGHYHYGTYTVRMKAVAQSGVVSSFFIYTGPSEDNPWDEIDIEITGNHPTQLQTNYYTNGVGGHEAVINLGFDASEAFHTYSIEWLPDAINWYVGDPPVLVHSEDGSNGDLPTTSGRIMMNFWPGTDSVNAWLGEFTYSTPIQAQYDFVSFEGVDWPEKCYLPLICR